MERYLTAAGCSRPAATAYANLFAACAASLVNFGKTATSRTIALLVPGRIEVLGKHTDYAGGRSMLAAIERGFCLIGIPRCDRQIYLFDVHRKTQIHFAITPTLTPTVGHWSNYPMTVARRIAQNFPGDLLGAEVAFSSNLPAASGMSSSSALMIATFLALSHVNRLPLRPAYQTEINSPEDLASYLATLENGTSFGSLKGDRGVGTLGGAEDQTAILCARPGQIRQYAYRPVRWERTIRVPENLLFAIAASGVVAEKTGQSMQQYNRLSLLTTAIVELWQEHTGQPHPHLEAIVSSNPNAANQLTAWLRKAKHPNFHADQLVARFEHFLAASRQIVPAVPGILQDDALVTFGNLADRSQKLGIELLGNQVPETIYLAQTARRLGAHAATSFGAGFGGSTWALIEVEQQETFLQGWEGMYRKKFPARKSQATFLTTRAGPAACQLSENG